MSSSSLAFLVQLATLLSSVAALASILIAVRVYRRQMNAQLFMAYTRRYEEVMSTFPSEARSCRLGLATDLPPRSDGLTLAVLRYLNLCSEEYYLCRTGHLSRAIWRIWEDELQRTLASELVRREWPDLRCEFDSYPQFQSYADKAQVVSAARSASESAVPARKREPSEQNATAAPTGTSTPHVT